MGGWRRPEAGKMVTLNIKVQGCIRPSYGPHKSLNWLKWREIYSRDIYSTPQSIAATHSHPETPFGHQTARTDGSEKQPAKAHHLSVACFEHEILVVYSVHGKKLNLLTWAIRPVFSDPVTYVYTTLCIEIVYVYKHYVHIATNSIITYLNILNMVRWQILSNVLFSHSHRLMLVIPHIFPL